MEPLRIGIITDVHNGPRASFAGELRKLSELALDLAEEFVGAMNRVVRPDVVVHLGDAVEDESPEADRRHYAQVMDVLDDLDVRVLHLTGNHDEINLEGETLTDLQGRWALSSPLDINGWRLLTLETHSDLKRTWVDDSALAQLEAELAEFDGPVALFSHHPLADQDLTGNPWFERLPQLALVDERARVRSLLASAGNVRAAFNGHVHWNHMAEHDGIPYFTVQSLIENISAPGAEPQASAAWAVAELTPDAIRVDVRGWDPADWEFEHES